MDPVGTLQFPAQHREAIAEVQAVSPGLAKDVCGRVYLDLTLKSDQKLMQGVKLVVKFIADDVKAFCHGYSTTFSESRHNRRLRLTHQPAQESQ